MIKDVIKAYEALNTELLIDMSINDKVTRKRIKTYLVKELENCEIICDESNNASDIIEECICVARVIWYGNGMEIIYIDLIFGSPEQIGNVQLKIS